MIIAAGWTTLARGGMVFVFICFTGIGAGIAFLASRDFRLRRQAKAEIQKLLDRIPPVEEQEFLQRLRPQDESLALKLRALLSEDWGVEKPRIDPDFILPEVCRKARFYEEVYWSTLPRIYGKQRLQDEGWTVYRECSATTLAGWLQALEQACLALQDSQKQT